MQRVAVDAQALGRFDLHPFALRQDLRDDLALDAVHDAAVQVFGVLVGRSFYLQIVNTDFLQEKGESRYRRDLEISASRGKVLVERLPSYPRYVLDAYRWHEPEIAKALMRASDSSGYARAEDWSPGLSAAPAVLPRPAASPGPCATLRAIVARAREGGALAEHEITTEVERYIAWPGQALAYKLGELQIRRHRREAEEQLGSRFDQRRFHDTILGIALTDQGQLGMYNVATDSSMVSQIRVLDGYWHEIQIHINVQTGAAEVWFDTVLVPEFSLARSLAQET